MPEPLSTLGTVSGDELRALLDGRWAKIREQARELAHDPRFAPAFGQSMDQARAGTLQRLGVLAEAGYSRLGFPRQYGGADDVGASITGFEMLAMGELSLLVKAGVQWGLFGGAVLHLGTERHHRRYLEPIMSLELLGCFAMTEYGHGSDVANLLTTATYDVDTGEFVVHTPVEAARKEYIGNAARDGQLAVVFAQLVTGGATHGVHGFLVPIRDEHGQPTPGVRIADNGHKAGLNGVDNGRLWFDNVRIPRENLLNRYGDVAADGGYSTSIPNATKRFFTMLGTLVQGRISVAGGAGSATEVALTIAVRYGEQRRQFRPPAAPDAPPPAEIPVLDYLAHQRVLLPRLAKSYALHFAQEELVPALHEAPEPTATGDDAARRELEARAAGIKAVATWHAVDTIQACREACGGAGYMSENRLPALRADIDVFATFEGDNTVLLQLLAKELLTGYREHFGELDVLGTVRFVADQAVETLLEKVGARRILLRLRDAVPRGEEAAAADTLRDRSWQMEMFDWREKHLLETLARRLRRAPDSDDPFAVFNAAQDHLLLAARAHVDTLLLDAFCAGIEAAPEGACRELLERVCDLYALSTIEAERGWFAEHGRLTASRSKAVIAEVNALCALLRPHARVLVDGFGVPEPALATAMLR
jgi:acyl-CoA oxidase